MTIVIPDFQHPPSSAAMKDALVAEAASVGVDIVFVTPARRRHTGMRAWLYRGVHRAGKDTATWYDFATGARYRVNFRGAR